MTAITKSFQYGAHTVTLSTGEIARQADGAVMIDMDGTSVLVTAVGVKDPSQARDFFPLTINYQERTYAAGVIPGGFFRREGRPTEKETLTARLIDRPLRPLFPKGFKNEVQVVATVMSMNKDIDPDQLMRCPVGVFPYKEVYFPIIFRNVRTPQLDARKRGKSSRQQRNIVILS